MNGAQWNQGVWTIFGITEQQYSCEHPYYPNRRLWMVSDFPYLIKYFRNAIMKLSAFQLFSKPVSAAMKLYQDDPRCPELHDASSTIQFITIVDDLIDAMMSRTPLNALRPSNSCKQKKAI